MSVQPAPGRWVGEGRGANNSPHLGLSFRPWAPFATRFLPRPPPVCSPARAIHALRQEVASLAQSWAVEGKQVWGE